MYISHIQEMNFLRDCERKFCKWFSGIADLKPVFNRV